MATTIPKTWKILHLSDLHIDDPSGTKEVLRDGHFREYIKDLLHAIKQHGIDQLDCIAVTGDFVHMSKVSNYGHAQKVLDLVLKEANLTKDSLVICPGNHDYVRSHVVNGEHDKALEDYHKFASNWANGTAAYKMANGRAVLCNIKDGLWALTLDATLGTESPLFGPGSWAQSENLDVPVAWVTDNPVKPEELLVVLSHYPVHDFGSLASDEEPDFHSRHIWTQGRELAERLGKWRSKFNGKTLWLSGDIHRPIRGPLEGVDFVTVGRAGEAPTHRSQQKRQAIVLEVSRNGGPTKVHTFNYEMPGHEDRSAGGSWQALTAEMRTDIPKPLRSRGSTTGRGAAKGAKLLSPLPAAGRLGSAILIARANAVETVDVEIESRLMDTIISKRLYSLGRFETNKTEVSLAWVSIGPLLNSTGVLAGALQGMSTWLKKRLNAADDPAVLSHTVLIGMDCWGAVLASQLSILTGARNICVASRGSGHSFTKQEKVGSTVMRHVKKSRHVVLIHDVVGSGRSLQRIHDEIESKLSDDERKQIDWLALSLICDKERNRSETCGFLAAHGTVCGSLRMPSMDARLLPDHRVCPPLVAFHPV